MNKKIKNNVFNTKFGSKKFKIVRDYLKMIVKVYKKNLGVKY